MIDSPHCALSLTHDRCLVTVYCMGARRIAVTDTGPLQLYATLHNRCTYDFFWSERFIVQY